MDWYAQRTFPAPVFSRPSLARREGQGKIPFLESAKWFNAEIYRLSALLEAQCALPCSDSPLRASSQRMP